MRLRTAAATLLALALLSPLAASALGVFPATAPNDPNFAAAEADCSLGVNAEQHQLYSFTSACTPGVSELDGASGMSVDRAWREVTSGRSDVTIAYIEGGINWHSATARDLVDQVFLNRGELPAPTTPVDDGRLNAKDYADSPDANGNGYVDPEDLIKRFSDGTDADHNGYRDDISGWDFYDSQNDPATIDGAYEHANNQMRVVAGSADNGLYGAGICNGCTILPIKAGAEAFDRTDDLAQAWLYAGDLGAKVLVSVTAELGYSTFMKQAVEKLWRDGVVMVEASNDFDVTDHQGGMFHAHVIPGNGLVTSSQGVGGAAGNALLTSSTARSGLTSWGTHNLFSASTSGGSTSESTPSLGGVFGLVMSAGLLAADEGKLASPLTGPEAIQVVRATASDIDSPTSNWPSAPGFDLQFGYGRPNAARAAQAVIAGDVPPAPSISSPDWYALYDPTRNKKIAIDGHLEARRSPSYSWKLEWALGAQPGESDFKVAGSGSGSGAFDGRLGTISLADVPRAFWAKPFALSKTKTTETNEAFSVTLRVRVTDAVGRVGEDRRAVAVHHDPSAHAGFPRKLGPSGEAQPQAADLQGSGQLALILGDADGNVHAIDGVSGHELPGWPVHTRATRVTHPHIGVRTGREPVIANVAVGDLDGDGRLSVVATSTTGRVYAWDASGKARKGWPRSLGAGNQPAIPRPNRPYTRLAHLGALAPPVLVDLDRARSGLEVVQSGWDGKLHAWRANGSRVAGWPVQIRVPDRLRPAAGNLRVDDQKLDSPPAVADLDGDGRPELVLRSQQADTSGPDIRPFGQGYVFALHAGGKAVAGWPVKRTALIYYYGSAQEFLTEGIHAAAAADVDGDGRDEIASAQIFSPSTLLTGDGSELRALDPVGAATLLGIADTKKVLSGQGLPDDTPVSFTTSGAFGRLAGGPLAYAEPGSGAVSIAGALLTPGSGRGIVNSLRAWTVADGKRSAGFPAPGQGLDFLGAPAIADVTGDGKAEVLMGGDASALMGYGAGGDQAPGFPKWHTGWEVYAPTVADLDGDGRVEVLAATREGQLMAWDTKGTASANHEWWSYRHDERNSARYGADTRPPGALRKLRVIAGGVRFTAPGDDWYSGTALRYIVRAVDGARTLRIVASAPAGRTVRLKIPRIARRVTIQALDDAGNLGTATVVALR